MFDFNFWWLVVALIMTPFMYLIFCKVWNKKEIDKFYIEIVIFGMAFSVSFGLVITGYYLIQLIIILRG